MAECEPGGAAAADRLFTLFCLAGFLVATAYGATFLLTLLVATRGGDEGTVGTIIAGAAVSTVAAVLGSGHLGDALGSPRVLGLSGMVLGASALGYATVPGLGLGIVACSVALGTAWGTFYTLGPVVLAGLVAPDRRAHRFALLSGSMMTGIGTGPVLGRIVQHYALPVEAAFRMAAGASMSGGLILLALQGPIERATAVGGELGASRLNARSAVLVLRSSARWPILMVGLGGGVFGGLSSFQTAYAAERGLDYSIFFLGFTAAVVSGRLALSGPVTRRDPYVTSVALTAMTPISLLMLLYWVDGWTSYLTAAVTLGAGYGLTYSVINGLAAGEAPQGAVAQALLLFSLSYFVGVFGFPALAGGLVAATGVDALLRLALATALLNFGLAVGRLVRRKSAGAGE